MLTQICLQLCNGLRLTLTVFHHVAGNTIDMMATFPTDAAEGWVSVGFKKTGVSDFNGQHMHMRGASITMAYFDVQGTNFVPEINDYYATMDDKPDMLNSTFYDSAALTMEDNGNVVFMMSRPLTIEGNDNWHHFSDENQIFLMAYCPERPRSPTDFDQHSHAVHFGINFFDDIGQQCDHVWEGDPHDHGDGDGHGDGHGDGDGNGKGPNTTSNAAELMNRLFITNFPLLLFTVGIVQMCIHI